MIDWDEPKRLANIAKHGLDFARFQAAFSWDCFLADMARPSRMGRLRYRFLGEMAGVAVVVAIVSPLGSEAISILSLRRASAKERAYYENWLENRGLQQG